MDSILVVGAGRLAATLLAELGTAGVPLRWWARPSPRRDAVQRWLEASPVQAVPPLELGDLELQDIDVALLAVSDRQVGAVALQLAEAGLRAAVVLHCAGALAVDPLRVGLARACGSCHPLAAVPDPLLAGLANSPLHGALFALDGDEPAQAAGRSLSALLGGFAVQVRADQRSAYHAAAALIANDWVALADAALQTADCAGLPAAPLRRGLLHLAETALRALQNVPADQPILRGLTGAVARGDAATLQRHLHAMEEPQIRELHRLASARLAVRCAEEGQLSAEVADQLVAALQTPPKNP